MLKRLVLAPILRYLLRRDFADNFRSHAGKTRERSG